MLTLFGLFLFALVEFLFDFGATPNSTNWSIVYFSITYISLVLICVDQIYKESSKIIRATASAIGIFFMVLAIIELSFINQPWEDYIVSVNDNKIRVIAGGILAIILIFITLKAWEKRRLKK